MDIVPIPTMKLSEEMMLVHLFIKQFFEMKKICIMGSTGSIGVTLLNILKKDKRNIKIELLTANKNYKKLLNQAKYFNVKNIIITDKKYYLIVKKNYK